MKTVRLHTSLYPPGAVEQAQAVFTAYGQFEIAEEEDYLTVRITAADGVDEAELVGEFANHALVNAVHAAAS